MGSVDVWRIASTEARAAGDTEACRARAVRSEAPGRPLRGLLSGRLGDTCEPCRASPCPPKAPWGIQKGKADAVPGDLGPLCPDR